MVDLNSFLTGWASSIVISPESGGAIGLFFGLLLAYLIFMIIIYIAIYIYTSLAYMKLAKKTNTEPAWLAWIPIANLYLHSKMAGMHWWPMLLLIGLVIPFVNFAVMIVLIVFIVIWNWKIFEKVGRPGWWAIFMIVPFVGTIIFLVLLGIAAWGKSLKSRRR